MKMPDWSNLPFDMLLEIAERVDFLEDQHNFGRVCTTWRKAIKDTKPHTSPRQTPLLMLPEPPRTSTRRFYSIYNRMVQRLELPIPSANLYDKDDYGYSIHDDDKEDFGLRPLFPYYDYCDWRYLSSRGWLICITQCTLNIVLIHPFTNQVIQLPAIPGYPNYEYDSYKTEFKKFAFSEAPSTTSHYTIAMIHSSWSKLGFLSSEDMEWTFLSSDYVSRYRDVTYYKGAFYAVDNYGKINAFTLTRLDVHPSARLVARLVADMELKAKFPSSYYLVESAGKLFVIYRHVDKDNDETLSYYHTTYFKVWEVDVETMKIKQVNKIGNRAIFVGCSSSFSVEESPGGCKANCVYYTDDLDNWEYKQRGWDMGVYDLNSGAKIQDYYDGPSRFNFHTPPLWLEIPSPL